MLSIANLLAIMIRELNSAQDHFFVVAWVTSQIIINIFFFLELLAEWYAFGIAQSYKKSFRCTSETISQVIFIFALGYYVSHDLDDLDYNYSLKLFELVVFVRLLRVLSLLYEMQTFRIIIETIKNLLGPFYSLLLV